MIKLLNKRFAFIIYSAIFFVNLLFLYRFNYYNYNFVILVSFIGQLVLSYFFSFKYFGKLKDHYLKFLYWSVLLWSAIVFPSSYLLLSNLTKVIIVSAISLFAYFNLLSINTYVVSEKRGSSIPLLQAGKLILLVSSITICLMGSTIIYKLNYFFETGLSNFIFQAVLFLILYSLLIFSTSWIYVNQKIGEVYYERLSLIFNSLQILFTAVLFQAALILMFFPAEDFGRSLVLAAMYYIFSNMIQSYLSRSINRRFIIESIITFALVYTIINFL